MPKSEAKKNSEEDGLIGMSGLGERNERGSRLVEFALSNQLAIKNTMFEKHPRRLYTWTSSDGKTKNQIDYIMVEKRWSSIIQDVTTKPSADCDTDHELLVGTMKLKLKCKKTTTRPVRYDVRDIDQNFTIETRNRFQALLFDIEEKEPDDIANEAKNILIEAAKKHLKKKRGKKQPWMTEETLNKIDERKEAKKSYGLHSKQYKAIAKVVKQMCKEDKKTYLIKKCQKIEDHMRKNKSREMYEEIKSLTKTFQPGLGVIKDKNGNTLTENQAIVDRWRRYCEGMYAQNDAEEVLDQIEPETEPQLPPLRSEIEWAIKSLKEGKSPGCDNIQAEMLKASGEEGVDVYHNLCTKIWQKKTVAD